MEVKENMEIIFICRDAFGNSLLTNIAVAMEAKKNGSDVAVVFTEEALFALAGKTFRWSPLLENRPTKIKVGKGATSMGINMTSTIDKRWTDLSRLIVQAKEEGILLLACPIWLKLLQVEGQLPPEISIIDTNEFLDELKSAKTVIGGF